MAQFFASFARSARRSRIAASAPVVAVAAASLSVFAEAKSEGTMSKMSNPRQWVHDALQGEGSTFRHAVGVDPAKAMHRLKNAEVFSGSSNPVLAEEVAYELHRPLGKMEITRYADGEISVKVLDSVRGKDVFVVQSTSQPVNENLMELLLTVSTMRRASAKSITAVIPYMGYKRDTGSSASTTQQLLLDQMAAAAETAPNVDISEMLSSVETGADAGNGGSSFAGEPVPGTAEYLISQPKQNRSAFPVSAADVAAMLQVMGVDRIITVDLQLPGQGQSEGFFSIPVENIRSTSLAVQHIAKLKPVLTKPVVVAPNEMCIPLAQDFQRGLAKRTGAAVGLAAMLEAGPSRGADRYVHKFKKRKDDEVPRLELVGDVSGCDVILVDDMIDTGVTLMRRLDILKRLGARRIVSFATHGLFNGSALQRITRSPLSDVIVTNTVPLREDVDTRHTHKIAQLSVAPLIAEAILRVQTEQSLQDLRVFDRDGESARYKGQE